MKKIQKRTLVVTLVLILCLSTTMVAKAATTVGSTVFSLKNFGNEQGTALRGTGSQNVTLTDQPNYITYIVTTNGNHGEVYLVLNGHQIDLTADGQTHTEGIKYMALPKNNSFPVKYTIGTGVSAVSISIVFSK